MIESDALLELRHLTVGYVVAGSLKPAVRDFSLALRPGERCGLVGESGCGKSTVALAIMQWLGRSGRILAGEIRFKGQDLRRLSTDALRRIRGAEIAMIYQEPMASLNPTMRIGEQLIEVPRYHEELGRRAASERARAMLNRVQLSDDRRIMQAFPHELSGGQQQRVVIAMALLSNPSLLLLDEPTTALDVTVEAAIVDLIAGLSAEYGMSMLYISHNLALLRGVCQRIVVMYQGQAVEQAPTPELFEHPQHAYTRQLLAAMPDATARKKMRPEARQTAQPDRPAPALEVRALTKAYGSLLANDRVSFDVRPGEIVALVGESGSGKSTVARILMGLAGATSGSAKLGEVELARLPVARRARATVRALQMIFQNPFDTLNPSHTIGAQIARVLRKFHVEGNAGRATRVGEWLERVRLAPELASRYPRQLSGGQKQRAAIARAFAGHPQFVVADEPVSALDVSVQASIVTLLLEMQRESRTTLLFISHDLALVRHLADRVVVMYRGRVVEQGPTEDVFTPPYHPYTEALLAAVPLARPGVRKRSLRLSSEVASQGADREGCCFVARCRYRIEGTCEREEPPVREFAAGHRIACHLPAETLERMPPVFEADSP